jgi:DNA-binding CsgD family transcriptional regulator
VLIEADDLAAAEQVCTATLDSCREVGDQTNLCGALWDRTILDLRAGCTGDAAAHLRELLHAATQAGLQRVLHASLDCCGQLCAATGRPAEAVTAWAAMSALAGPWPQLYGDLNPARRDKLRREVRELLDPARARAAEERGAAMSLATAAEYALLLASEPQPEPEPPAANRAEAAGLRPAANGEAGLRPAANGEAGHFSAADGAEGPGTAPDGALGLTRLSPRERELVMLVAQGRTDAQIAAQLYITVRTVSSHLDRVRDKTGCRRRADLTRLALSAGLV